MKKYIVGLLVGILLSGTVVYAANYLYHANEVSYTSNNKNWDVDNVKDALDELYSKIDSGVTVCNSSTSTPIFKYEAAGVEDDYVYICEDGEWNKLNKAGLRWDGIILDGATYDADWFSPTWTYSPTAEDTVGSSSKVAQGQQFVINSKWNAVMTGWIEYVMGTKAITVRRPSRIRIWYSFSLPQGDTTYRVPLIAIKKTNTASGVDVHSGNTTKAPTNSIDSKKLTVNNSYIDLNIDKSNVNTELYLSVAMGVYCQGTIGSNNVLTIKKIQILSE